jgi:hypothetical protein
VVTVVQRDWCLQVVQFVGRGLHITIKMAVPIEPIVELTESSCGACDQGKQVTYYALHCNVDITVSVYHKFIFTA